MKVVKIEQNSEEWLEYRKGKSGGSEFKDLWVAGLPLKSKIVELLERDGQPLSPEDKRSDAKTLAAMLEPEELAHLKMDGDKKRRYYEIIAEEVARPITPNDYVDRLGGEAFSMMARGHLLEKDAIEMFTKLMGDDEKFIVDANPGVWESDHNPNIYISPDAAITDKDGKIWGACEVKCLSSWEIVKAYLEQNYPKEYEPQVIKYFVVNEDLEKLYFLLYTDVIPGLELQTFVITRESVADRIAEARAFENEIMEMAEADIERIKGLSF